MSTASGERISMAMDRKGLDQRDIAAALKVDPSVVSKITRGETRGRKHLPLLAKILDVSVEWITTGLPRPSWAAASAPAGEHAGMSLVGIVQASGPKGLVEFTEPPPSPFPLKPSWDVVKVAGMSAYPICYPDQFVIIDTERATNGTDLNPKTREDLHDNIVLVQVSRGSGKQPQAYLKRFCRVTDERAPGGYVMASVDAGRSSPFIAPEDILAIVPVVGVIYEDPQAPRRKRYHTETVVQSVP